MRKEIFSRIQKQIQKETPELDLRKILDTAIIPETKIIKVNTETSKSKSMMSIFFKYAISFALIFFLTWIFIPSISPFKSQRNENPESETRPDLPTYLTPALSLYFLKENKGIEQVGEDGLQIYLQDDIIFLNHYFKSIEAAFFSTPNFQKKEALSGYHHLVISEKTILYKETKLGEKTNLEIKIIDKNQEYYLEGYLTGNNLYLKLTLSQNSFLEMNWKNDWEFKIFEDGRLISHALIKETETGIELINMSYHNMKIYYIINQKQNTYEIEYDVRSYMEVIEGDQQEYNGQEKAGMIIVNIDDILNYEVKINQNTYYFNSKG
jgi:hypothetical protein